MRDKIELLIEETGAPPQEAELALGLANFNIESALKILHGRMRDVFVVKAKFLCHSQQMYGLMLFIAHVAKGANAPSFRLRFVFSANPHLYETNIKLEWDDFEKEIYRARLSEWCHMAFSQSLEKEWEEKIALEPGRLYALKEALLAGNNDTVRLWLEDMIASSEHLRFSPKYAYATNILSVGEYRQGSALKWDDKPDGLPAIKTGDSEARESEIFFNLKVALESAAFAQPREDQDTARPVEVCVADLLAGDIINVYVLDTRDTGVYLAEIFGGYSDYGLEPIEAPVESIWREGDLVGVRVRFANAVVGEGTFPHNLRIYAIRKS